jgi:hypothetical protein
MFYVIGPSFDAYTFMSCHSFTHIFLDIYI